MYCHDYFVSYFDKESFLVCFVCLFCFWCCDGVRVVDERASNLLRKCCSSVGGAWTGLYQQGIVMRCTFNIFRGTNKIYRYSIVFKETFYPCSKSDSPLAFFYDMDCLYTFMIRGRRYDYEIAIYNRFLSVWKCQNRTVSLFLSISEEIFFWYFQSFQSAILYFECRVFWS